MINIRKVRKGVNKILIIYLILFFLAVLLCTKFQNINIFACSIIATIFEIASPIILLVSIVAIAIFWRCPRCNKALPFKDTSIKYCPYCRADIDN